MGYFRSTPPYLPGRGGYLISTKSDKISTWPKKISTNPEKKSTNREQISTKQEKKSTCRVLISTKSEKLSALNGNLPSLKLRHKRSKKVEALNKELGIAHYSFLELEKFIPKEYLMNNTNPKIAVIGLGYVGLPLAVEFAK